MLTPSSIPLSRGGDVPSPMAWLRVLLPFFDAATIAQSAYFEHPDDSMDEASVVKSAKNETPAEPVDVNTMPVLPHLKVQHANHSWRQHQEPLLTLCCCCHTHPQVPACVHCKPSSDGVKCPHKHSKWSAWPVGTYVITGCISESITDTGSNVSYSYKRKTLIAMNSEGADVLGETFLPNR